MRSFDWYAVRKKWPSRCQDLKVSGFGHSSRTRIDHVDQGSKVPVKVEPSSVCFENNPFFCVHTFFFCIFFSGHMCCYLSFCWCVCRTALQGPACVSAAGPSYLPVWVLRAHHVWLCSCLLFFIFDSRLSLLFSLLISPRVRICTQMNDLNILINIDDILKRIV